MKDLLSTANRILLLLEFAAFYLKDVVASNLRVAWDVLTPAHRMRPAVVAVPIRGLSDRQLLAFSNLLTMTPGTLSLDVNDDRSELLVHIMYVDDAAATRRQIEDDYLRRIRRVF